MQRANLSVVTALLLASVLTRPYMPVLAEEVSTKQTGLTESEVEAFAKCYIEIGRILDAYEPHLNQARSIDEAREIYKQALSAMLGVLRAQQLSQSRYIEIFEIARSDDSVLKRIVRLINEEQPNG